MHKKILRRKGLNATVEIVTGLSKARAVSRQPLNEQVYEILRDSILYGKIPEETKLNEVDIANQLDVSPTPVREAFRRLAMENLVTIQPWKGVVVKGYSEREIAEMYQCREALEGMAARLAAQNMPSEEVAALERMMECVEDEIVSTNVVAFNRELHHLITKGSGNRKLASLLQVVQELIWRDMKITAEDGERRRAIYKEHTRIVQAIKDREPDAAERIMREHICNGYMFRYGTAL